ncbi:peptidoglycan DD-metalloendopeptidase family protein [Yinghuangia sp. ASG 101]|uniref:murein hydrolase activator EnvC family protein n=1 Tax=Yinghuangia sp. ASG 101 TaxID=2896848 RepID=UPI001E44820D|nr:M23 family metallopeptidase [Yinghuangia sp. ASG 101]UGQ09579.1 peptidoglycan DD-metalloendopeptidase family protein [Yinghuangia sp. ASG 101]
MYPTHSRRLGFLALIAATAGAVCWGTAQADDDTQAEKQRVDSQVQDVRVQLDGAVARLAAAESAYAEANAGMPAAQAALAETRRKLDEARVRDTDLRRRLEIAVEEEATAQRQLRDVEASMGSLRDSVGQVARRAYQQGSLSGLSVVVRSETPAQMMSRIEAFRTLMRADEAAIARLKAVHAEADGRQKALARARDQVQADREAAAAHVAELTRLEAEAATAATAVEKLVEQRRAALATAQEEKTADQQRYESLVAEQGRLTELVNRLNAPSRSGSRTDDQGGALSYPVDADISSTFGSRFHPILEVVKLHTGTDFAAPSGTPVRVAREGTVIAADYNTAYGNRVVVSHGRVNGVALTTTYNHLSRIDVAKGAKLTRGQIVGLVGTTGYSTGPHLHFEVLADGKFTDPMTWL